LYDISINEAKFDIKVIDGNIKRRIEEYISGEQANNYVLELKSYNRTEINRALGNIKKRNFNTLILIYKNEMAYITKNDILNNTMEALDVFIKKDETP
jgi:hypothetical protein